MIKKLSFANLHMILSFYIVEIVKVNYIVLKCRGKKAQLKNLLLKYIPVGYLT